MNCCDELVRLAEVILKDRNLPQYLALIVMDIIKYRRGEMVCHRCRDTPQQQKPKSFIKVHFHNKGIEMIGTVWPENLAGIKFGGLVINSSWRILIWRFGFRKQWRHIARNPNAPPRLVTNGSVDCATVHTVEAELPLESCFWGHHVYKRTWTPSVDEEFSCKRESGHHKDPYRTQ